MGNSSFHGLHEMIDLSAQKQYRWCKLKVSELNTNSRNNTEERSSVELVLHILGFSYILPQTADCCICLMQLMKIKTLAEVEYIATSRNMIRLFYPC